MPARVQGPTAHASPYPDSLSSALEKLLNRHSGLIRHAVRRLDLQESDVDEVLQDVRIRIWRSLSTREKIALAPASYVYRTAVTAGVDLIRRRKAHREEQNQRLSESRAVANDLSPDRAVELAEFVARVAGALSRIRESRRLVVRLHLAGYHRSEIADTLGWTEAKTRNLLYRGLADLRQQLGAAENASENGRHDASRR